MYQPENLCNHWLVSWKAFRLWTHCFAVLYLDDSKSMNEWKMICGNRMAKFLTLAAFVEGIQKNTRDGVYVCIIRNVEGVIWERQRGIIFSKNPPLALDKNNVWVLLQCFPQPGRNQRQHSHNKTHSGREHCGGVTASRCLIYTVQSPVTLQWSMAIVKLSYILGTKLERDTVHPKATFWFFFSLLWII